MVERMTPVVVIDTNVIVSASFSLLGNPGQIFTMLLRQEIHNFTTEVIIGELRDVLYRQKIADKLTLFEREFIFNNYVRSSTMIKPAIMFEIISEDPDDNKLLDCAFSAAAEYIISGDNHLLKLKEFRGIKIISPVEFVKLMDELKEQHA